MSTVAKVGPAGFCVFLLFQFAGCSNDSGSTGTSSHESDRNLVQSRQACVATVDGEKLFIGEPRCLSKLPQRRMSGLWVLGLEHSIFHEDAKELPSESYADTWLEADVEKILRPHGLHFDGKDRVFKVDFIGTKSDAPGVYGHAGSFQRGAMVLRMISLDEVTGELQSRRLKTN